MWEARKCKIISPCGAGQIERIKKRRDTFFAQFPGYIAMQNYQNEGASTHAESLATIILRRNNISHYEIEYRYLKK